MARVFRARLFLALALVVGVLAPITVQLADPPAADAVQATGGDGRFKAIEWFSWGADGATIPNAGTTRTETYTVAGQQLAITCSLSNISRASGSGNGAYLQSYRSGNWQGDGFDELYNIGGPNAANTMVVGLSNNFDGNTINLDFGCSATLGGVNFPLAGLVMADAEASGSNEYVGATIPTSATWRILDRVRGADCNLDAYMRRTVSGTSNRLEMYGPANNTCETGSATVRPGPSAVAFMDGVSSATNVTIQGGGKSAIALGVALNFDFGDAPASYGQAGAALQFAYTGGEVPITTGTLAQNRGTPVFGSVTLAENTQPPYRLGNTVDPEISPLYSSDALGDDTNGTAATGGPDDEDALTLTAPVEVSPGQDLSFTVRCVAQGTRPAYVAGWLDWDRNGTFDAGDISSNVATCPAGSTGNVTLAFAVPSNLLPNGGSLATFLRLRTATSDAEVRSPTGVTTGGEVEDHAITLVTAPRLQVAKQVGGRLSPTDQFTVTMSGTGLPTAGVSATTTGTNTTATSSVNYVQTGRTYTVTDAMTAGSSSPLSDYAPTIACIDRGNNNAAVAATAGAAGTWTLPNLSNGQSVLCTVTNTPRPADLDVAKTAGVASGPAADGSYTVTYQVTATNSGPQGTTYGPLTDTPGFAPNLVVDQITWTGSGGAPSGTYTGTGPATLAPAGTAIARNATHTYAVTVRFHYTNRTDARPCTGASENGLFNNAALPAGQESGPTGNNSACVNPPAAPRPRLALDKSAGPVTDVDGNGTDAGDTIAYTFAVTNTGNVNVTGLAINDAMFPTVSCPVSSLAPGASTTCTATHTLTQADLDAGSVNNTAVATGADPNSTTVTSPPDSTSTPLPQAARIGLDKRASAVADTNGSGRTDAGDRITYTFVVSNDGNTTVTNIAVADPMVGAITCPATTLAPGASTTCTAAPYTLTQADLDAGTVTNTATATGRDRGGAPLTSTDSTTTRLPGAPALTLDKQAAAPVDINGSGITDAGDTIAYTFVVTNTGNVTVHGLTIADNRVSGVTCPVTSLAPGATTTCTAAPYAVTAADEVAGSAVNTATARGRDPGDTAVESAPDSTSTPVTRPAPRLAIDKRAGTPVDVNGSGITDAGDTIAYTFTVTNTGNVPVRGVSVSDPTLQGTPITCTPTTLAPGASASCGPVTKTVTTADETAGTIENSATAGGTDPDGGRVVSPPDTTSTPVSKPAPSITILKQADPPVDVNGSGITDAGDTIAYTFRVTNTGNVPLSAVSVTDPMLVGAGITITCPSSTLAANGASMLCAADRPYPITAADVANHSVDNSATAAGRNPDGGAVTSRPSTTSTPTTAPTPGLGIRKTAGQPVDVNNSGITDAGDTIAYTFTVTNTGNVPIRNVTVNDPKLTAQDITITCTPVTLAPGGVANCATSKPYVITADDVAAGAATNTARATGTNPDGGTVTSPPDSTTTTVTRPAPLLELEKTAGTPVDVNGSGITDAGDRITYTFTVTNRGNVPIRNVTVNDPKLTAAGLTIDCGTGALIPGATRPCTVSGPYTVTAADVTAGAVTNTATASGSDPDGGSVTSPPDGTNTPTTVPAAALTVEKTAGAPVDVNGSGITDAGDTIVYTFTVTNTGNVPIRAIAINDPKLSGVTITCPPGPLAPGANRTCTSAPYTVTAADVTAGAVTNTARATGTNPDGGPVTSPPDTATVPVTAPRPALSLVKTAGAPVDANNSGITDAGDTITYTFTVTNTGNVPIRAIAINDPTLSGVTITCPPGPLAPGANRTCTSAPYTVTAADVTAGAVTNTARATGTDPDDGVVRSDPSTATVPTTTPAPALGLVKHAGTPVDINGSGITDAGDTIVYTFTVTNTGNVPIHDLTVLDPKLTAQTTPALSIDCPAGALAPGISVTCTASNTYVVTAADVSNGSVANTARVRGTDPDSGTVASAPSSTTTPTTSPQPALQVVKRAGTPVDVNNSGITDAGDTITYTFTVTNTGNVPVRGITVTDPKLAGAGITIACTPTTLAPNGTATCTTSGPYTITAADVTAGVVANTATAHGTDPDDKQVISPPSSTSTPTTTPQPGLTVDKSAGPPVDANNSGITDAGDTITYTFTVTNTGNVPVRGITVTDPKLAGAGITIACTPTTLAPNGTATCTTSGPYTITATDVTAGSATNTATATGTDPDGKPITSPPDSTSVPTTLPRPALHTRKVADPLEDVDGNGPDPGDTIRFHFVVTNTGNVPLTTISISDPMLAATPMTCDTLLVLRPGESGECTSRVYVTTQDDFDAGSVNNTATGSATDPDGGTVTSPPADTSTPLTQVAALRIVKHAAPPVDVNGSGITDRGDTIQFTFEVSNPGNVTVYGIEVVDPMLRDNLIAIDCPRDSLEAGETMTCEAARPLIISANQVDLGHVTNTATAQGKETNGTDVTSPPSSTTTPTTKPQPQLTLVKTAGTPVDVNDSGLTDAGDTIAYSFTVTNTGNVPIDDLAIDDPMLAAAGIGITCDPTRLEIAPGANTVTCTADRPYPVTAQDVAGGATVNTATATGSDPDNSSVTSDPSGTTTPTTAPEPQLLLDKRVERVRDVNGSGLTDAGDTITYAFTATNTGNVPIDHIAIDDPMLTAAGITLTCPSGRLAVGAAVDCTTSADYTVTGADERAGSVANTAHATGIDPDDDPVTSPDADTSTPTTIPEAGLRLEKSVGQVTDVNGSGLTDAGDTITYTFTVTNTGNVPIRNVTVNDPKLTAQGITIACDAGTPLATGASRDCVASGPYTVTPADEAAGAVANTATAGGTDPDGDPVTSPPDDTSTPATTPKPSLQIDKAVTAVTDVNGSGLTDAGDTITYSFAVTNTGNVPVNAISVVDGKLTNQAVPTITITCPSGPLAPGGTVTCAASAAYVVTSADVAAGSVANSAVAQGSDPDGDAVQSPPDQTSTPTTRPTPGLTLVKTVDHVEDVNGSDLTDAGDTITYGFSVTNNGNVPIENLAIADAMLNDAGVTIACPAGSLAVGATVTCSVSGDYTVTVADERAGAVHNTATAKGTDPDGGTVTSPPDDTTTPTTEPRPSLRIVKSVDGIADVNDSGLTDAPDEITYSFTVTNSGNVAIHDVAVTDDLLTGQGITITCAATSLAVGASTTCTPNGPYVITGDDQGSAVVNVATAHGEDPDGDPVRSPEGRTSTPTTRPQPALEIDKSGVATDANQSGLTDAGDTIVYTFKVTNTGNVPIDHLMIDDPKLARNDLEITCETTTLAVGASTTCTSEPYTVVAADETAGAVVNSARAVGEDPNGDPVRSPLDDVSIPVQTPRLGLDLVKSAHLRDKDGDGKADAGEKIEYTFKVTNTGNVPVIDITVHDEMLATAGVEIACPTDALAPGASLTCTATYTVTLADQKGGKITNVATASGTAPSGKVSSNDDKAVVPAATLPPGNNPGNEPGNEPGCPDCTPPLADTGGPSRGLPIWGLSALAGGAMLLWASRRRSRTNQ